FSIVTFLGTLMQLLVYLLASKYDTVKRLVKPGLVTVLALVAGGFLLYQRKSGLGYLEAASNFFNAKGTQFIPFWGWMKGFVRAAIDGNLAMVILFLVLTTVGVIFLIWFMWRLKVDFYEDAMAKSEEVAAALEAVKENNTGLMKRKKDRSDKLERDGFHKGSGANVYFFKNMYNRKRFAHFGFLTKTMEFYLIVAVAAGLVCRLSIQTKEVMFVAAVFAVMVFMRSLGNHLEEDTKMAYFVMIPESAWAKMFYSYLAEFVGTAIDLSIPMVVSALIMGGNPLEALAWTAAILSINAYSCAVGTFIGITVPNNAGVMIKQFAQVMFVYFGLVPDIVVLAFCAVLGQLVLGVVLALLLNLLLGMLFFFLAAQFLEPHGGSAPESIL
ncbi:MAG: hypothetical protein IKS85_10565, partial [Lachnospiraceae bacterium]|nr:hypothetical protein [Lachnospiraceae bacterium]